MSSLALGVEVSIVPFSDEFFGDEVIITKDHLERICGLDIHLSAFVRAWTTIDRARVLSYLAYNLNTLQQDVHEMGLSSYQMNNEVSRRKDYIYEEWRDIEQNYGIAEMYALQTLYVDKERGPVPADYLLGLIVVYLHNLSWKMDEEKAEIIAELHQRKSDRPDLSVVKYGNHSTKSIIWFSKDGSVKETVIESNFNGKLPVVGLVMEREAVDFFKEKNSDFWNKLLIMIEGGGVLIVG